MRDVITKYYQKISQEALPSYDIIIVIIEVLKSHLTPKIKVAS